MADTPIDLPPFPPDPAAPSAPPTSVLAEGAPSNKHPIWNRVFFVLQIACLPLAIWWIRYSHLPPPGWAVAFIAGAAAAMSVHDDMKGWQKGLWMLIIGAFLVTELRAIRKDRIGAEHQANVDRKTQEDAFSAIRTTQNANFTATAQDLTAAISGIKSTLTTANTTLQQTQPHAALSIQGIEFSPSPPTEIKAGTRYEWNYHFLNTGTATATDLRIMREVYVGDADDRDAQIRLADRFNKAWKVGKGKTNQVIVPNVPGFMSVAKTFSDDEMKDFGKKTIYFIFRFEYSDGAGRWRMDECEALQRRSTTIDTNILHPCQVFVNARYPVKPQ